MKGIHVEIMNFDHKLLSFVKVLQYSIHLKILNGEQELRETFLTEKFIDA
jgi:hypothetical protein